MRSIIYIFLCLSIFTACSNKVNVQNNTKKIEIITKEENINSNDDFTDDFGSEFEEEFNKEDKKSFDPLKTYNSAMTSFNDFIYMNVLRHISKGYAYFVPQTLRIGISNVIDNLLFPVRFTNNLLQFKVKNASEELGRFLLNSTFGLAGLMDVAQNRLDLKPHNEDFGQTLAFYGVEEGFHIVLPFLGPSNLRDFTGLLVDSVVNPLNSTAYNEIHYKIPNTFPKSLGIKAFETINVVSLKQGQYENLRKDALDLYPFFKNVYNQKRNKEIKE